MTSANVKFVVGGLATAAVLGYAHLGHNIVENSISSLDAKKVPFECCLPTEYYQDSHYSLQSQAVQISDQIEIIHNVVSSILEHTEDLDPRISKLIDENFWDLG